MKDSENLARAQSDLVEHPTYEVVKTTRGVWSIRHKVLNEIMHNPVGPWQEAQDLYIDPSGLAALLSGEGEPVVLFDVGLGAASNALAAIQTLENSNSNGRKLCIYSFERDLELLRFTCSQTRFFPPVERHLAKIETLLARGCYQDERLEWILLEGNFAESLYRAEGVPDLIFYDPYSPAVNAEMWSLKQFLDLRRFIFEGNEKRTRGLGRIAKNTLLITYSQATPIRSALIGAGFYVGYGPSTGLKEETTQAATSLQLLKNPLGGKWYRRWKTSHKRYPALCLEDHWLVDLKVDCYFARPSDCVPDSSAAIS